MSASASRTVHLVGAGDRSAYKNYCQWQEIDPEEAVFVQVLGAEGTRGRLRRLPSTGCTFEIHNYGLMSDEVQEILRGTVGYSRTLYDQGVSSVSR